MRARAGTRARREEPVALTARQEEVLRLLERGLTNTEIAAALGISLDGAKFHVSEIIGKLGVATREEAVEAWRQRRRARRFPALFSLPLVKWGLVAAAAGGIAVVAMVVGLSRGDDSPALSEDETPQAQGTATGAAEPTQTAEPSLAACPEPLAEIPTGMAGSIDWKPFVVFNGVLYARGGWASLMSVSPESLGPAYGRVAFTLTDRVLDPSYVPRDCDASRLAAGTVLHTVDGYQPTFRIATQDGKVYEAYQAEGIGTAGEVMDLRGKARAIEFRTSLDDGDRVLGRVAGQSQVASLVEEFLTASYDWSRKAASPGLEPGGIRVIFLLDDGTEFDRPYWPDTGLVLPAFWLPESFNEAALAAIAAGME